MELKPTIEENTINLWRESVPEHGQQRGIHAVSVVYVQMVPSAFRGELFEVEAYGRVGGIAVGQSRRFDQPAAFDADGIVSGTVVDEPDGLHQPVTVSLQRLLYGIKIEIERKETLFCRRSANSRAPASRRRRRRCRCRRCRGRRPSCRTWG